MRYIKPNFYDKFSCTADKCPDTCCAGWQIMIDEDSLELYGSVPGDFGRRLRNSIDWQEGSFNQYDRRCAFLNEKNLCDLYTELGSEALCETCRKYPRHVEEYEGVREWSLSLSCPVAAQIILSRQGFPEFVTEEDDEPDELEDEFEDFDLLLFTQLEDARSAVFKRLQMDAARRCLEAEKCSEAANETETEDFVQRNMNQALALAADMQRCLEEGKFCEIEEVIRAYGENSELSVNECGAVSKGMQNFGQSSVEEIYASSVQLYQNIYDLERLRIEWTDVLQEMYGALYQDGAENYSRIRTAFENCIEEDPEKKQQWENIGLQLFVFFVYTYFCGAVYDDWIYSKMALAVHSVEFIRELFLARWELTGKLDMEDYVELSYRYAREIEHSDQNLNELEEIWNIFLEGIDN